MSGSNRLHLVRSTLGHAVISRCCEQNCLLRMTGICEFLVLKGEELSRSRVCDCIIFYRRGSYGVALVELKSSYSHAGPIAEKFTNTLKIVRKIAKNISLDVRSQHLVLLSKNHPNPIANDLLRGVKINSNGSMHRIRLNRCGDSLLSIICSKKLNRRR